jgi:hypothetical protein
MKINYSSQGVQYDIDEMDIEHLRMALKHMVIRNEQLCDDIDLLVKAFNERAQEKRMFESDIDVLQKRSHRYSLLKDDKVMDEELSVENSYFSFLHSIKQI